LLAQQNESLGTQRNDRNEGRSLCCKKVKSQQKSPNSELLGLFDMAEWTGLFVIDKKIEYPIENIAMRQ
jgi:hypothetical protein